MFPGIETPGLQFGHSNFFITAPEAPTNSFLGLRPITLTYRSGKEVQ